MDSQIDRPILDAWFARKLQLERFDIKESREVWEIFSKQYGARADYAGVLLAVVPASSFSFRSIVQWEDRAEQYETAILDSILDEILCRHKNLQLNAAFELREIKWHFIDSSFGAFYKATRAATKALLDGNFK